MTEDKNHPANPGQSPEGGDKDTTSLHDLKDVQRQDMQDKGEQVDQTPESVTGADVGQHKFPQNR